MNYIDRGAKRVSIFLSTAIAVIMASTSISAVASEDAAIDEVIVTSSLSRSSEVGLSGNARVLNGEDILNGATGGLGNALDDFLGMSVTDFGSAVSRPTIRGLTGDRVKVLNNGIQTRDVSGLGADHSFDIDLFNVQQVEIIKGPASLLYANGASGGIVNIVDNTVARTDFTESTTILGMETQDVSDGQAEFFAHQSNLGGFNVSASYKNADFGNYDVPFGAILHTEEEHHDEDEHEGEEEHEEGPIGSLKNSDYEQENVRFGISKVQDWGYIGLSYASNEGLYGVPFHQEEEGAHGEEGEGGHDEHEDERIFAKTDSEVINLEGSFKPSNGFIKNISYYFRDTDYSLIEAHAEEAHEEGEEEEEGGHHEEGPTEFTNEAQEFGAVFDISSDILTQKISIEMVSEETAIIGAEKFMNPADSDEFTLGYYASRDIGGFAVDFAIRNDWIERKGSVTPREEHGHEEEHHDEDEHEGEEEHEDETQFFNSDSSATSFAVQVSREINDQFSATLNLASVEKAPATVELYMNGPHLATGRQEVGNPNFDNERSNNIELTLAYSTDNVFGSLSVYSNQIDDYVYLQDETEEEHEGHDDDHGGLIEANYMQQDAEFQGYEFEIGTVFDFADGDVILSYGRDSVSAKFNNGGYVPRINPDRNVYTVAYERGSFDMAVVLKNVQAQTDFAVTETPTQHYDMLDVRASQAFQISDALTLNVSIFGNNLLDEVARNHSSFVKKEVPLPGRNYGLKFNAQF
jgi:iron complex outermembrane receptor protein